MSNTGWCHEYEQRQREARQREKRTRAGWGTAALAAYDREQFWREQGESAIAAEMERLLRQWLATKAKKGITRCAS